MTGEITLQFKKNDETIFRTFKTIIYKAVEEVLQKNLSGYGNCELQIPDVKTQQYKYPERVLTEMNHYGLVEIDKLQLVTLHDKKFGKSYEIIINKKGYCDKRIDLSSWNREIKVHLPSSADLRKYDLFTALEQIAGEKFKLVIDANETGGSFYEFQTDETLKDHKKTSVLIKEDYDQRYYGAFYRLQFGKDANETALYAYNTRHQSFKFKFYANKKDENGVQIKNRLEVNYIQEQEKVRNIVKNGWVTIPIEKSTEVIVTKDGEKTIINSDRTCSHIKQFIVKFEGPKNHSLRATSYATNPPTKYQFNKTYELTYPQMRQLVVPSRMTAEIYTNIPQSTYASKSKIMGLASVKTEKQKVKLQADFVTSLDVSKFDTITMTDLLTLSPAYADKSQALFKSMKNETAYFDIKITGQVKTQKGMLGGTYLSKPSQISMIIKQPLGYNKLDGTTYKSYEIKELHHVISRWDELGQVKIHRDVDKKFRGMIHVGLVTKKGYKHDLGSFDLSKLTGSQSKDWF